MTKLCQYVDVCIANEEDAKDVFGIAAADSDIYGGKLNKADYESVARQLARQFGFETVAITLRTSSPPATTTGRECCITAGRATCPRNTISTSWTG